jgi:hypothetical protein
MLQQPQNGFAYIAFRKTSRQPIFSADGAPDFHAARSKTDCSRISVH